MSARANRSSVHKISAYLYADQGPTLYKARHDQKKIFVTSLNRVQQHQTFFEKMEHMQRYPYTRPGGGLLRPEVPTTSTIITIALSVSGAHLATYPPTDEAQVYFRSHRPHYRTIELFCRRSGRKGRAIQPHEMFGSRTADATAAEGDAVTATAASCAGGLGARAAAPAPETAALFPAESSAGGVAPPGAVTTASIRITDVGDKTETNLWRTIGSTLSGLPLVV